MKTYKNLYPRITDFANLDEAWRKARRGNSHPDSRYSDVGCRVVCRPPSQAF